MSHPVFYRFRTQKEARTVRQVVIGAACMFAIVLFLIFSILFPKHLENHIDSTVLGLFTLGTVLIVIIEVRYKKERSQAIERFSQDQCVICSHSLLGVKSGTCPNCKTMQPRDLEKMIAEENRVYYPEDE